MTREPYTELDFQSVIELEDLLFQLINRFVDEKKMYPHQHKDLVDAIVKSGWGVNFDDEEELDENIPAPSLTQQLDDLRKAQETLHKKLKATEAEYIKHLSKRS